MKKPFCQFLCLLLFAVMIFSSVACGSSPAPAQQAAEAGAPAKAEEPAKAEPAEETTPEPTAIPTEEPAATPSPEPTPEPTPEPLIQKTVVVDNVSGVTVIAKELQEKEDGYLLWLDAKNNSDGFYLNLVPSRLLVNGISMNTTDEYGGSKTYCLAEAGRGANDKMLIPRRELELLGIESIDMLEVSFEVNLYKSSTGEHSSEKSDPVCLIQKGEPSGNKIPGSVFYNDGQLLLSVLGLTENRKGIYFYYDLYDPAYTDASVDIMHQYDENTLMGHYFINGTEAETYFVWIAEDLPGIGRGCFAFYPVEAVPQEEIQSASLSLFATYLNRRKYSEKEIPAFEVAFDENGIAVLDPVFLAEAPEISPSASIAVVTEKTSENGAIAVTGSDIFENDQLKITVTDVKASDGDLILTVKAENKSEKAVKFSDDLCLVNGYQVTAIMSRNGFSSDSLDPGTEAEYRIYLYDLDRYNMTAGSVSEIKLSFLYGAPGAWASDMISTDQITVTLDQQPAEPLDLTGYTVLYDANDVKIIYLRRSEAGTGLLFYVENNTDQKMSMTADSKMKIDGYGTSDWPVYIAPGVKRVVEYSYYSKDGSLLGIDWKIQEATVGFQLVVKGRKYSTMTVTETLED